VTRVCGDHEYNGRRSWALSMFVSTTNLLTLNFNNKYNYRLYIEVYPSGIHLFDKSKMPVFNATFMYFNYLFGCKSGGYNTGHKNNSPLFYKTDKGQ
jgi:hypothetical protein